MGQEDETSRDKLIYDIIVDRYDREWDRTNDLDSKASNVTGFAGLLATLTAGITQYLPRSHLEYLFLIPMGVFIASAVLGLLAYWTADFIAINPDAMIQKYSEKTETEVLRAFVATTSEMVLSNHSENQRKVRLVRFAFLALIIAIGSTFVVSIVNLLL